MALILLGLGLDEFSMPPQVIPELKFLIRSVSLKDAQKIAEEALTFSTGIQVEEFAQAKLREILK